MRILLVHQNFPGQFLHLAPALAARGHEVVALTAEGNSRPSPVRVLRYRTPAAPGEGTPAVARTYAGMAERGVSAVRAAAQMREKLGFVPDLILGHSGWGETLFLREVWPEARLVVYAELLYRSTGLDAGFDPEFQPVGLGQRIAVTARAAHLAQALVQADAGIAPTEWQAATFPPELWAKIAVLHDGIDTGAFAPDPSARFQLPEAGLTLRPGDEVLSFVNRNLEPYRGWHIFARALPAVLEARPAAQVVVLGGDGVSYGRAAPGEGGWRQVLLDELGPRLDLSRVHFLGRVPHDRFRALMQVTRAHAYLTYPFVLSWSMLEAMAAGALVIGSRTGPVTEVIEDGVNGRLVDFFDVEGWSAALTEALADPAAAEPLRAAARRTVQERYDLRTRCLPRLVDFLETGRA